MAGSGETWVYFKGDWHQGDVAVMGPRSHAFWLASAVFDGARAFEGVTPDLDLQCARVNESARLMHLKPDVSVEAWTGLVADGLKKFESDEAIYIRPMYWADESGYMGVPPDPDSTQHLLCLHTAAMVSQQGFSMTVSPYRRPTLETMPTNAKAACLYPNNARMLIEAKSRGFDNALALDMLGNVAETAVSNIFMARDGVVFTPMPNGCFLNGITRQRNISLMREAGIEVVETTLTVDDFKQADEIFSTGNHSKIVPVTRFEDRDMQPGPLGKKARQLYWDYAHS